MPIIFFKFLVSCGSCHFSCPVMPLSCHFMSCRFMPVFQFSCRFRSCFLNSCRLMPHASSCHADSCLMSLHASCLLMSCRFMPLFFLMFLMPHHLIPHAISCRTHFFMRIHAKNKKNHVSHAKNKNLMPDFMPQFTIFHVFHVLVPIFSCYSCQIMDPSCHIHAKS